MSREGFLALAREVSTQLDGVGPDETLGTLIETFGLPRVEVTEWIAEAWILAVRDSGNQATVAAEMFVQGLLFGERLGRWHAAAEAADHPEEVS
jgi:hypothetical protein